MSGGYLQGIGNALGLTTGTGNAIDYRWQYQMQLMQQMQAQAPSYIAAPIDPNIRARPHKATNADWLDRRVDEIRVKL